MKILMWLLEWNLKQNKIKQANERKIELIVKNRNARWTKTNESDGKRRNWLTSIFVFVYYYISDMLMKWNQLITKTLIKLNEKEKKKKKIN